MLSLLLLSACHRSDTDRTDLAPEVRGRADGPSWSRDIQPLVARHCLSCHAEGEVGAMPFETWEQTAPWASVLAEVTRQRLMPPFPPVTTGACGTFADAPGLSDAEIARFDAWAATGAPEGDPATLPSASEPRASLPRVDATMGLSDRYTPDGGLEDDYRCFLIDPRQPDTRYVTGFELVPGDAAQVHHAAVFAIDSDASVADARALDAADPGPGWSCAGREGLDESSQVAGWVPGSGARQLPEGTGIALAGGRPMVLSIHYNTSQGVSADDTVVRLMLEDTVKYVARIDAVSDRGFVLAPGEPSVTLVYDAPFAEDTVLYGVSPHMHTLGTSLRAELVHADDTVDCLVDVPRWDFHWQGFYFYEAPVQVREPDVIRVHCAWSTLGVEDAVSFGKQTTDEMCALHLLVRPGSLDGT